MKLKHNVDKMSKLTKKKHLLATLPQPWMKNQSMHEGLEDAYLFSEKRIFSIENRGN